MQEVPIAVCWADLIYGAAAEGAAIDVPVHGRQVDVFPVRIEDMIVVELGETRESDADQPVLGRGEVEAPEQAVRVDVERGVVEGPVRRLDEHRVGLEQQLGLPDPGTTDPDLCALSRGECPVFHGMTSLSGRV